MKRRQFFLAIVILTQTVILTRVRPETHPCGFPESSDSRPRPTARRFWNCSSFHPAWPDICTTGKKSGECGRTMQRRAATFANALSQHSPFAREGWGSLNSWFFRGTRACFFPQSSLSPDVLGRWEAAELCSSPALSFGVAEEHEEGLHEKICPFSSPVWPWTRTDLTQVSFFWRPWKD